MWNLHLTKESLGIMLFLSCAEDAQCASGFTSRLGHLAVAVDNYLAGLSFHSHPVAPLGCSFSDRFFWASQSCPLRSLTTHLHSEGQGPEQPELAITRGTHRWEKRVVVSLSRTTGGNAKVTFSKLTQQKEAGHK
ncbi:unnamed protein product [Boreogadus saida]